MKKTICLLAALVICWPSSAKVVGSSRAESVASNFIGGESVILSWKGRPMSDGKYGPASEEPAFRVYQGKDEWVIVSGDDSAVPVLAHGTGTFPTEKDMPANMRAYLEGLGAEIIQAHKSGLVPDERIRDQWKAADRVSIVTKASGGSSVGPLTADIKWTQDSPYNALAPVINGSRSKAGCVATAVAIVLRYYKWPERGRGIIPGYTLKTGLDMPEIDIQGYAYDWDNMPLKLTSNSSAEEKNAVASLMLHVGCMLKMEYSPSGSGTTESGIPRALWEFMSYSRSSVILYAADYSHDEWFSMIKNEIDRGRPLIYTASSSSEGHCMVCDGYDTETRMISVNWGWGSGGQGWYVLNTMNGVHKGWPFNHSAVFGLIPDRSGNDDTPTGIIGLRQNSQSGAYGLQLGDDCPMIWKNGPFTVSLDRIYNNGNVTDIDYKVVLSDRDNVEKENISGIHSLSFVGEGSTKPSSFITDKVECEIQGDYVIGDRIRCYYSTNANDNWYPMGRWTRSWYNGEAKSMFEMNAYDLDVIELPTNMKAGSILYPQILYGGRKAYKSVIWYYDGVQMEEKFPSVILEPGSHELKAVVTYVDDTVRTIFSSFDIK